MVTSSLNPNVVKTFLDGMFYPEWDIEELSHIATAEDPMIFMQDTSDKAQETTEEFRGVGAWETRGELQDAPEGQPMSLYTTTFVNSALAKGCTIPKRFFDDDQVNMIKNVIMDFAEKGRAAKNKDAFSVYRNAFSATLGLIGDGVAAISASHPIVGGVESNLLTSVLNEASINDAIVMLGEQAERDGVVMGRLAHFLLVPMARFKSACIITESELRSGTNNNDENVYSSKYNIFVKTSPYLGAAISGGSDARWFVGARRHGVVRFLREDVNTHMIPWQQSKNRTYFYDGEFRQSVGAQSYIGLVGSNATTGSYDL